jgi:hypothetical protein
VMRTAEARAAGGHRPLPMGDRLLLFELALRGRLHLIDDALFMLRDHPGRTVRRLRSNYRRLAWHDPNRPVLMPHWELTRHYLSAVREASLSRRDRLACRAVLLRWLFFQWNWAKMLFDVLVRLNPRFVDLYEAAAERQRKRRGARRRASESEESAVYTTGPTPE